MSHDCCVCVNSLQEASSTMIAPSKPFGERPVNEKRAANDILRWKIAPRPGVEAVHCVIPHYHVMLGRDVNTVRIVSEKWREILVRPIVSYVARIMTFASLVVRIEPIDFFKVRG